MIRYDVQLRAAVDGDRIVGHASVFGQLANVGPHWEQINRGAFDKVLKGDPDVVALVDHDQSKVLGRSTSGTLRLDVDDEGLAFEVDLPDTSYANDLRALVARGDVTGASFGFLPGADSWSRAPDGRQLRSHVELAGLRDVSVVTFPAYKGAGVALRSIPTWGASNASKLVRARAAVTLRSVR